MMKTTLTLVILALSINLYSHCQVPCGIYGDDARFTAMLEDLSTVRKAMTEINSESAKKKPNHNQLIRWVNNKESHAQKIQDTVSQYFLAQRIKASQPHYTDKLKALHQIIVSAMKCKQTADTANAEALEKAIKGFQGLYSGHHHDKH